MFNLILTTGHFLENNFFGTEKSFLMFEKDVKTAIDRFYSICF